MKGWGIPAIIGLVILAGLALRYGNSSNYILADMWNGFNGTLATLSLQRVRGKSVQGNNPSGSSLISA